MPAKLRIDGLAEFTQALYDMPQSLSTDSRPLVHQTAEEAKTEIFDAYPDRTGKLRDGLTVTHQDDSESTVSTVRNTAPHADMFEHGTQARHTALGANRGTMPPGHVFVPIAMRKRRALQAQLIALLTREGFTVTGNG